VAAVSAPLDLAAGGAAIDRGFNRLVYTRMFLATMKPKALRKWQQHPGLFDQDRLRAARTIYEFDDAFTAPLHGFAGTTDYWARAAAKPHLQRRMRVPALALNARNDPFVPAVSLPTRGRGRALGHAVAAAARGATSAFRQGGFPGPRAGHAAGGGRLAAQHDRPDRPTIGPWTTSSKPRCASGPTCRTATAGWRWTRAATGTCATTASRPPGRFPQVKGSRIRHDKLLGFIHRNYAADAQGPGSSRTARSGCTSNSRPRPGSGASTAARCESHTGRPAQVLDAWLDDECGRLFLRTDIGFGLVHSLDMAPGRP
jgi:hypothetical protein